MSELDALTRAQFLKATGGVAFGGLFASALSACGGDDGAASGGESGGRVVYAGFGGTFDDQVKKNLFDPFTKKTGIEVVMTADAPPPIAPMQAQVRSGKPAWDFVIMNSSSLAEAIQLDLVEPIDYSKLPNADDYAVDSYKHEYGAGLWAFCDVIWWNTDVFDQPMESWADVWDVKRFPGKRGFLDYPHKVMEEALLADGVEASQLYPLDMDRAFNSLDRIRPNAVFLDINTINNQLAQQDLVAGGLNITRIKQAITDGVPVDYSWTNHIVDASYYSIPKGAEQVENVYELTNFVLSPEIQATTPDAFGYTPATNAALAKIPEKQQADLPASTVTVDQAVLISADWWAEHTTEASERFTEWLQS